MAHTNGRVRFRVVPLNQCILEHTNKRVQSSTSQLVHSRTHKQTSSKQYFSISAFSHSQTNGFRVVPLNQYILIHTNKRFQSVSVYCTVHSHTQPPTHQHTCMHTHACTQTRTCRFALILMCPVTGVPSAEPGSLSMLRFARATSPNIERAYKLAARNPHSPVRAWRTGRSVCLLAVLKLWVCCQWSCRVIVLVLHEYMGTYAFCTSV